MNACFCSIYRGDPIPHIDYTPEEVATWGTALSKLKALFPTHACKEFNSALPMFEFRSVAACACAPA